MKNRKERIKRRMGQAAVWLLAVSVFGSLWAILWSGSAFYIQNPNPEYLMIVAGRALGLLAQFLILSQFILISRFGPLERLFGYDHLTRLHRTVGEWLIIALILHPLLLIIGNARLRDTGFISQFSSFFFHREYVNLAVVGLALFVLVIVWSLSIVRRRLKYEQWYFVHLLMYVAAFLSFFHQLRGGDFRSQGVEWYWMGLAFVTVGILIGWRFLRPLLLFLRHRFVISSVVSETHDTWSVVLSGQRMQAFRFLPGQYASLRFLTRQGWQAHPFSFSSVYSGETIRFTIKAVGDFTKTIPLLQPGTSVIVDGPLGQFTLRKCLTEQPIFIAGGSGITPLRAMIESLVRARKETFLFYGIKSVDDMILGDELREMEKTGYLKVVYVLSKPTSSYESGYIDSAMIAKYIPTIRNREVFLCGPKEMMKAVTLSLRSLGLDQDRIHQEEFSF